MICGELPHLAEGTLGGSAETTPPQRHNRSLRERQAALGLDTGFQRFL